MDGEEERDWEGLGESGSEAHGQKDWNEKKACLKGTEGSTDLTFPRKKKHWSRFC